MTLKCKYKGVTIDVIATKQNLPAVLSVFLLTLQNSVNLIHRNSQIGYKKNFATDKWTVDILTCKGSNCE